jgi:hypothetical protein
VLYLGRSYLLGEEAEWARAIVIMFSSSTTDRSIDYISRYIEHRYGATAANLPSIRLIDEDYLINIPDELSSRDIMEDSRD